MDQDDDAIFQTVLNVVTRYGMRRTTMAELARGAGVSRQTLYDRFGDKDGIMAATIEHAGANLVKDLRLGFAQTRNLEEKLDCYLNTAVWPAFEIFQAMPDAADLETGMGPASIANTRKVSEAKQKLLAEVLAEHLEDSEQSAKSVAEFLERATDRAKKSEITRDELEQFLAVLKASILALARA